METHDNLFASLGFRPVVCAAALTDSSGRSFFCFPGGGRTLLRSGPRRTGCNPSLWGNDWHWGWRPGGVGEGCYFNPGHVGNGRGCVPDNRGWNALSGMSRILTMLLAFWLSFWRQGYVSRIYSYHRHTARRDGQCNSFHVCVSDQPHRLSHRVGALLCVWASSTPAGPCKTFYTLCACCVTCFIEFSCLSDWLYSSSHRGCRVGSWINCLQWLMPSCPSEAWSTSADILSCGHQGRQNIPSQFYRP